LGVYAGALSLVVFGLSGMVLAPVNFAPFTTKSGQRSDGLLILETWRQLRAGDPSGSSTPPASQSVTEMDATLARWFVFYSDSATCGAPRDQIFGAPAFFLGYATQPAGDPRRDALHRLAHAGWCWREAERGDQRRLREAALDAVHQAPVARAPEPQLTILAARQLLTSKIELGLGSPGDDDEARTLFLAEALRRLPPKLRPGYLPRMHQMFAFRYGVAVHDIERARTA
jgi:hypothetical protein